MKEVFCSKKFMTAQLKHKTKGKKTKAFNEQQN